MSSTTSSFTAFNKVTERLGILWGSEAFVVCVALVYAAVLLTGLPTEPVMEPDSGSYLSFAPIRQAGYPLFLAVFGPVGAVVAREPIPGRPGQRHTGSAGRPRP
ncbi:MAG: hypothetical protein ABT940_13335, partial [Alphaproteobacteria bacterium]